MPQLSLLQILGSFFLLYAETHYAFKGIYSRLKRDEPEILADVPHRIEPNHGLPILILVKDADRYPIKIYSISVKLRSPKQTETFHFDIPDHIQEPLWHRTFEIKIPPEFHGHVSLDVAIRYARNGRQKEIRNDNYAGTSHAPFDLLISDTPLPKSEGWYFGDFHCHTSYTSDQVEFGAPLAAASRLAAAMGLSFYCATDHSYDLDDHPEDFLKNDPQLSKWNRLLEEIAAFNNSSAEFVIVPGEEVSAGNAKQQNVHFLILNHPEFLPGDGDSAEKWFRTKPNLSIKEVLDEINSEAVAFAAHPAMKPPLLQRLLVRRGSWSVEDCIHPHLHGLQVWNGTDADLRASKEIWIRLLLSGERKYIAAGNDAHGNFNRFRQIGFPFFTMREHHEHLFGKVRTAIWSPNGFSLQTCLQAFKKGRMVVTNGPFAEFTATSEQNKVVQIAGEIAGRALKLVCDCRSSPEFGKLAKLRVLFGDYKREQEIPVEELSRFPNPYLHTTTLNWKPPTESGYLRVELYSEQNGQNFVCLTNPIWLTNLANEMENQDLKRA